MVVQLGDGPKRRSGTSKNGSSADVVASAEVAAGAAHTRKSTRPNSSRVCCEGGACTLEGPGHVAGHRAGPSTRAHDAVLPRGGRLAVDVPDRDAGALGRQRARDRAADRAAAAGDDRHLARESFSAPRPGTLTHVAAPRVQRAAGGGLPGVSQTSVADRPRAGTMGGVLTTGARSGCDGCRGVPV